LVAAKHLGFSPKRNIYRRRFEVPFELLSMSRLANRSYAVPFEFEEYGVGETAEFVLLTTPVRVAGYSL